jgi:hypothetical protein
MTPSKSHKAASLCTLASCLTLPLCAATFTLNPAADSFVAAGTNSGNNYGAAGALSVAAPGLAQGEFQSLMRFDLSTARAAFDAQFGAGQWTIQSMSLLLSITAPSNPIFNASATGQFRISWMQNDSWIEGSGTPAAPATTGITFATLPSFLSAGDETLGTYAFPGGTAGTELCPLALTPGFSTDAAAGNLVSFRLFAADPAVSYVFDSRNFGNASLRPLLSLVAVPEPAAVVLFGIAGVMLVSARGRSRKPQR